ncbi:MAG: transcriptional regulator, partial [Pseudomonadota bacterium]
MDGQMDEVRIGSHILQTSRQLLMNGERVHLGPRALDILTVLAKANGEIVTKDELFEAVWPGQVIEENALHAHITAIRKALEEDAGLLETIRGIGYQLHTSVGEDAVAPDALVEPAPAPLAPSSIPSDTPEAPIAGVQAVPPSKGAHRRKLLAGAAAAVLALIGVAYVATVGLP